MRNINLSRTLSRTSSSRVRFATRFLKQTEDAALPVAHLGDPEGGASCQSCGLGARLGEMAMILVFDRPCWLRFFCSPTGGGTSLIPDRSCPAWDFEWVIPESDYEVGKEYRFRMRLIYKRYVSDDDVLREFRETQSGLGYETVP